MRGRSRGYRGEVGVEGTEEKLVEETRGLTHDKGSVWVMKNRERK